jgi:hypothetical protein
MRPQTFTDVPSTRKPLSSDPGSRPEPTSRGQTYAKFKKITRTQPSRARTRQRAALSGLARALFPRPIERGILGLHAAKRWSAILHGLRQGTSRIRPSPAYLPRPSPRRSRRFLRSLSTSSAAVRACSGDVAIAQIAAIRRRRGEWVKSDPLLPFKNGPANGRKARKNGLRLKALVAWSRSVARWL